MSRYFDTFKGSSFEHGFKVCTNEDGSKVWAEMSGNASMLSQQEREMLKDTARKMGARLIDPEGVYRRTAEQEAMLARSRVRATYEADVELNFCSKSYADRSKKELYRQIAEYEADILDDIGRRF